MKGLRFQALKGLQMALQERPEIIILDRILPRRRTVVN